MDPSSIRQIIILLILLLLSAFFSSAETALTTVNKHRMRALANQGNKKAARVLSMIEKPEKAIQYYREYYAPKGIFENEVYEGIPEMLAHLTEAGFTLLVATDSNPQAFPPSISCLLSPIMMASFASIPQVFSM